MSAFDDTHIYQIAHPALASIAVDVFNKYMPGPNQMMIRREDVNITQQDLLNMNNPGKITEEGIRINLRIGIGYMNGWLLGYVFIFDTLQGDKLTASVTALAASL